MLTTFLAATLLVSGCALGALLVGLWMRSKIVELDAARKLAEVNAASAQTGPAKMAETFQALADTALRSNQQSFLDSARSTLETVRVEMTGDLTQRQAGVDAVVKPLANSLVKLEAQISELESARQRAFGGFEQQLQAMALRELDLQKETAALVTALRAPQVRGRWGELTLRRVAELAGMAERCDFFEQETQETDNGRIRPDMIVRLPGDRTIVVDAKAPLTAYLDAVAASSDVDRRNALLRHSQQVA
jgi:DNA recombination protein RmuC